MEERDEKTSEENNINPNEIEKKSEISNELDQNLKRPDDGEGEKGKNRNSNETEQNPNDPDEDEEEECGFCLFMKSGDCRDAFIAWEKCVEEAEANNQDVVEKCYKATCLLKECMDSHADYYAPVLRAEKEMEEQVAKEIKEHDGEASTGESGSQGIATIEVPNEIAEVPNPTSKVIIPQENSD